MIADIQEKLAQHKGRMIGKMQRQDLPNLQPIKILIFEHAFKREGRA
jgi:hypothetical protein